MKKFPMPELEIVRFDSKIDTADYGIDASEGPCDYDCPSMYGNACQVNHVYNPDDQ